jgi:hypothetical protein
VARDEQPWAEEPPDRPRPPEGDLEQHAAAMEADTDRYEAGLLGPSTQSQQKELDQLLTLVARIPFSEPSERAQLVNDVVKGAVGLAPELAKGLWQALEYAVQMAERAARATGRSTAPTWRRWLTPFTLLPVWLLLAGALGLPLSFLLTDTLTKRGIVTPTHTEWAVVVCLVFIYQLASLAYRWDRMRRESVILARLRNYRRIGDDVMGDKEDE